MTLPPFKMIIKTEMEKYRHDTWDTKEPETIEWIQSFKDGDVFFDIGANIGIYSLYCASIHPFCMIHAFEPMLNNFLRLQENIEENDFVNIYPWHIAISDKQGFVKFESENQEAGSSGGQVKEGGKFWAESVDSFVSFGFPNHIKIDIDGQEWKVLQGMKETIKDIKSVLVEVAPIDKKQIVLLFMSHGFTIDNKFNKMKNHSRVRRAKEGIHVENIVFTRTRFRP